MTFDEDYFNSEAYADVSFARFSQYWWSNRYYALLARKHGPKQGRVLEIGCGLGHLLGWLTDKYEVFGGDINPWALSQSKVNVPEANYVQLSAEDLGMFPDESFQIVISKHNLEHLPNPENSIAEMSRVLSTGGLLIMATPNLDSPMRKRKGDNWIGYKDPSHISLKPPSEWLELLENHHIQAYKVFSDGFWDSPYVSWLPNIIQKVLFGAPGGLQAILGWSIIPHQLGESLIILGF